MAESSVEPIVLGKKGVPLWLQGHTNPTFYPDGDVYDSINPAKPPYNHQRRAVNDAVKNLTTHGFHALFMEMGTGKTKTTIDTWMALVKQGRIDTLLVVAPKTLLSTWTDEELPKHATIEYGVGHWDGKTTKKSREQFDALFSHKHIVYVVNVEGFQSLNEELRARVSKLLRERKVLMAVDEASTIKGYDAKRSNHIVLAGELAKGRMILTGTEISKGPLDLFMQFQFLKPGFWKVKSFYMFRAKYAILEDAYGAGQRTFKKVVGYQKINELMDTIAPFVTRALKKDCLDLPPKIRQRILVDLTPSQEKAYGELKKHLATILESGEILTVENKISLFTKFRQITGGTIKNGEAYEVIEQMPEKLKAIIDDVEDTDEQAIIWCAFRGEVQLIAKALAAYGTVSTYDGSTDIDDRSEAKVAFQEGRARFFVSNMKAGSYGLNLQNCHLQYFYSRDTSPQANWQAEDRSHRPGQTHPCVYKSLLCRNTVDIRILDLIEQGSELRDILRGLSNEDMYKII